MGFGWQELLIIAVIVTLIFGTKKLRNIGGDLGGAVKGFKKAMSDDEDTSDKKDADFEQKNLEQQNIDAVNETEKTEDKERV